eukprot:GABV01010344.1.p1 GENE.GABV01010344.1~~GABV01010344.1.p1  ORF type:complete len:150 (+),score=33.55 GABV01010344.1:3-452(+)
MSERNRVAVADEPVETAVYVPVRRRRLGSHVYKPTPATDRVGVTEFPSDLPENCWPHFVIKYGLLNSDSVWRVDRRSIRRDGRLPNDFSFGKSAQSALETCVWLYNHIQHAKKACRPGIDMFYQGEMCPQWQKNHPRLPKYTHSFLCQR